MTSNSDVVLKVENLSKVYRLGEIGTGTISHDLNRWWAKMRGKEDPFAKIGSTNDRTQASKKGEYVKVLDDINFEVKRGEVLGVIGKNGAGKSTLLKVISQITSPTSGSIRAKGRIASLLEVGTGMHPEMTGKENVYLNGTILGMTKKEIDSKFYEIMEFAGCAKYEETPVKRYSSGMKVRLGFAVAAFLEPEILIVDEVLAVGDADFQRKAIGKMQDISSSDGRTVIFVSHNMGSVSQLCNRAIFLENGRIKSMGKTDIIINEYFSLSKEATFIKNSDFHFSKLITVDSKDEIRKSFFRNDKIIIKAHVTLFNSFNTIRFSYRLVDSKGNVLTTFIEHFNEFIDKGDYITHIEIPSFLLSKGQWNINVSIDIPTEKVYASEIQIGQFDIVDEDNYELIYPNANKGYIKLKNTIKTIRN